VSLHLWEPKTHAERSGFPKEGRKKAQEFPAKVDEYLADFTRKCKRKIQISAIAIFAGLDVLLDDESSGYLHAVGCSPFEFNSTRAEHEERQSLRFVFCA
jgi:hypothetical protein